MTRVLVVDDHDFFRSCIVDLVNASPDLRAVGECRDGAEVHAAALRLSPDVVLMDVEMRERDGFEALGDLAALATPPKVLFLSSDTRPATRARARACGAFGFLAKGISGTELLDAIRAVAGDRPVWADLRPLGQG